MSKLKKIWTCITTSSSLPRTMLGSCIFGESVGFSIGRWFGVMGRQIGMMLGLVLGVIVAIVMDFKEQKKET